MEKQKVGSFYGEVRLYTQNRCKVGVDIEEDSVRLG